MKLLTLIFAFVLLWVTGLRSQTAPTTETSSITDAVPGDPSVPVEVTVSGFQDIGQFHLTLKFETDRVQYVSATPNPSLPGMTVTYHPPVTGTQARLVLAWTGAANASLANGSTLAELTFHYVSGTGLLSWAYTFGSVCQYKRYSGGLLSPLADLPRHEYYHNGGISDRAAPAVSAPVLADPQPGPLPVPLISEQFTGISSMTLYLEYDPVLLTYQGNFTKNPAFDSNFIVGDQAGMNGMRQLAIQWYGGPVSLAEGDTLCTLDFTYNSPSCDASLLTWYDNGPSCEFSDANGQVLIDMPRAEYYADGLLAPGLPVTWTGEASGDWDDPANWTDCGTPGPERQVVIPNVSPLAHPVIGTVIHCRSVTVENGAILQIQPGGILYITKP